MYVFSELGEVRHPRRIDEGGEQAKKNQKTP